MCVSVFHHVLLKYGHESTEMQKKKIDDVIDVFQYLTSLMTSYTEMQRRNFDDVILRYSITPVSILNSKYVAK